MKYVICDIDGTISHVGDRLKYLKQKPANWDLFYDDCFEDKPIKPICDLLNNLCMYYDIIFLTGRREAVRQQTLKWIDNNLNIGSDMNAELLMRPDEDHRHDTELKPELLSGIGPEDVAFILEDRNSMVKKWRELGFTCLQVADGDF